MSIVVKKMVKSALVLCGGGSKGAFEVGVLKVLLQKWMPDVVIGTSVGAINGSVLLDGPNIFTNLLRLEQIWLNIRKKDFFKFNKRLLYKFHLASSFYANSNMVSFLESHVKARRFEQLLLPFYVNCTRLRDGSNIFFHKGGLIPPVVASCAVPPLLPPYEIDKEYYFDGGLGSYIGIDLLKQNHFKKIVIVSLIDNHNIEFSRSMVDISKDSLSIIRHNLIRREIELCRGSDVITLSPSQNIHVDMLDFSRTKELIQSGEREARNLLRKGDLK